MKRVRLIWWSMRGLPNTSDRPLACVDAATLGAALRQLGEHFPLGSDYVRVKVEASQLWAQTKELLKAVGQSDSTACEVSRLDRWIDAMTHQIDLLEPRARRAHRANKQRSRDDIGSLRYQILLADAALGHPRRIVGK